MRCFYLSDRVQSLWSQIVHCLTMFPSNLCALCDCCHWNTLFTWNRYVNFYFNHFALLFIFFWFMEITWRARRCCSPGMFYNFKLSYHFRFCLNPPFCGVSYYQIALWHTALSDVPWWWHFKGYNWYSLPYTQTHLDLVILYIFAHAWSWNGITFSIFTRGQYLPPGIVVSCVSPSVRPSVRPSPSLHLWCSLSKIGTPGI